jgi:hypothetical protein
VADHACQSLGGVRLDERVAEVSLAHLFRRVWRQRWRREESERSWIAERVQREKLVEQACYEAERARRQFDRVEPENRLVARTLERAWERTLSELAQREADVARFLTNRPDPLNAEEMAWLQRAGADLQTIWHAPTTTHRDRKQLLRCLISEVVVTTDRDRVVAELAIIWVGGAVSHLTSRLNRVGHHQRMAPAKVLELVRKLGPHYSNEHDKWRAFLALWQEFSDAVGMSIYQLDHVLATPAWRVDLLVYGGVAISLASDPLAVTEQVTDRAARHLRLRDPTDGRGGLPSAVVTQD